MKLVLDTCVLYPLFLRRILLGVAEQGLFAPLWSEQILAEWAHVSQKSGYAAGVEIALIQRQWPHATVAVEQELALSLPDQDDIHVLAAAISAHADGIVTQNAKDFPSRILARHGLVRWSPDMLLLTLVAEHDAVVQAVVRDVLKQMENDLGTPVSARRVLKRSALPRLARYMFPRD